MAHKKGLGSSKNGRDSNPKYLGVKMFDGQAAEPGNIIVRQRGTKFRPGPGTQIGRDDTIFAIQRGHDLVPDQRRAPHRLGPRPRGVASSARRGGSRRCASSLERRLATRRARAGHVRLPGPAPRAGDRRAACG